MEATEGTNREGHRVLAGWRILGERRTVTQEPSSLAESSLLQRTGDCAEVFMSNAGLGA